MRWVLFFSVICLSVGCKNQATPLANPFLSPDRVPPPSTGTIPPGTAQPFYPAATVPAGVPAIAPAAVYPPTVTPTQPTYSTPQAAPLTPPGGWGQPTTPLPTTPAPYNMQPTGVSDVLPGGTIGNTAIQVAPDSQPLHLGTANATISPRGGQPPTPYVYTPPVVAQQGFATPVQFAATSVTPAASDGFRPQGSTPQTAPGTINWQDGLQSQEDPQRFGFDATYSWLRGQLQYYPQTGYWGLRYIPQQGAPDPYGGVVVIDNPDIIANLQPGAYLQVQGYLDTQETDTGQFLPLFTVEGVQLQQ